MLAIVAPAVFAQSNALYNLNPQLSEPAKSDPMLMLALSGDHQVFLKAYNDFDDLDGDGLPDVTYNHNVVYKGYFNEEKCYTYNASDGRFNPTGTAVVPTTAQISGLVAGYSIKQYCAASEWSGNFLNWATMTRIDIVRGVLYGGKRSTDTSSLTVLERAYLPNDAHSFTKYYNGSDLTYLAGISTVNFSTSDADKRKVGLTFCNTSLGHAADLPSQEQTTTVPTVRVARGNYSLWASSERYQCLLGEDGSGNKEFNIPPGLSWGRNGNDPAVTGIYAYDNIPKGKTYPWGTDWLADLTVRVAVCTDGTEDDINYCRRYGNSNKPTGLLQAYGIDSDRPVKFGLITGATNKNKTGGVLRKNISSMADEVNPNNGVFLRPATGSIVASIDAMQILDYVFETSSLLYANGTYLGTCDYFWSSFNEGQCRNWGNPFSEIMAESYRYLAGARWPSLNSAARTAETSALAGATVATWQDPIANPAGAACVNLNVLGINASGVSYDSDIKNMTLAQLGIGSSTDTIATWTNLVGAGELDSTKTYFVGGVSGSSSITDGQCTPKTVTNLADVQGTCPETPRLQGSYLGAGLAYYSKSNSMRPDVTAATGKVLNINTLGLTLAGTQPVIYVPGTNVKIIPACKNNSNDPRPSHNFQKIGNCAMKGFRPVYDSANTYPTKYYVTWEDTEQGSDYDQDLNGIIEFEVDGNRVEVNTTLFQVSTGANMFFGYIISGTEDDGLKLVTETNIGTYVTQAHSATYTVGNSDAEILEPPLYYATKWGSYSNSPEIDDARFNPEVDVWRDDNLDLLNYALVSNPSNLRTRLGKIIVAVGKNNATGTATPISINSLTGEGMFLQTVYQPVYVSPDDSSSVTWVGTLSALFYDQNGNIREDTNGDNALDADDKVIEFVKMDFRSQGRDLTETRKVIGFNRYPYDATTKGKDESDPSAIETNVKMNELNSIWSARDQLAEISDTNIGVQRGSLDSPNSKRYIFTGLDGSGYDGNILPSETLAFEATDATAASLQRFLDVGSVDEAKNVINYIRGKEISGYRNRTVKFVTGGANKVWRLGDIVNSTPAIVGAPSAGYDNLNADASYYAFRTQYQNRRNMVYVGANDGLVHAFNAGYFNNQTVAYTNTPTGDDAGEPALGAEMWAYAPFNLLPHLKWLTRERYEHVFYVDSNVKVFDAKIFASKNQADKYPGGWGTIMVVGMRFGGGEYQIDRDGNPLTNDVSTLRSAYMVFDITDPESTPELITEVTDPSMGFTLASPELVKNGIDGHWYLAFGSGPQGPDATEEGISNAPAKLFYLNLKNAVAGTVSLASVTVDTGGLGSYVGGITAKDWNNDYIDDMLYLGFVGDDNRGGNVPTPAPTPYKGSLKQASLSIGATSITTHVAPLIPTADANLAFSTAPLAVRDGANRFWIFTGTGRFLVNDDINLTDANQYFGFKVNNPAYDASVQGDGSGGYVAASSLGSPWYTSTSVSVASMRNVTNDQLFVNDTGGLVVETGDDIASIDSYLSTTSTTSGWYRSLPASKEVSFTRAGFFDGSVVFNSYRPSLDACNVAGDSPQYILDMFTGLPQYRLNNLILGIATVDVGSVTHTEVSPQVAVIPGIASSPVIAHARAISQNNNSSLTETDISLKPMPPVREAWREISAEELR